MSTGALPAGSARTSPTGTAREAWRALIGHYAVRRVSGVPQGSVLGLLLFTAYVSPVRAIIESFGVSYHQFVDDTQLLVAMNVNNATQALERLANCSAACCPVLVPAERSATQRGQVGGRLPWNSTSAQIGCHYPSGRGRWQQAAGCTQAEVARCNN